MYQLFRHKYLDLRNVTENTEIYLGLILISGLEH